MNRSITRSIVTFVAAVVLGLGATVVSPPAPAAAAAAQDSTAVAVNTRDGASIFRLAFHVVRVVNGAVDQGNAAVAVSSCSECQTIALAFQVILVMSESDTVTPTNLAIALNVECSSCVSYAAATQLVLGTEGIVRFTPEGQRRLAELRIQLLRLRTEEDLTIEELEAIVDQARAELKDILATELEPVGAAPAGSTAPSTSSTTTSAVETSTTRSTTNSSPTSSSTTTASTTTTAPTSSSTSTTAATSSTTTTTAGG